MEFKRLTKKQAETFVDRMNTDPAFYAEHIGEITNPQADPDYEYFREGLVKCYERCKRESIGHSRPSYYIDLHMAEETYRLLESRNMTLRDAADDEIWLYFNLKVIPDIIFDKYKDLKDPNKLNRDRFFENSRRFYLKMLWWYVFLSWQGSIESTIKILKNNESNDISQLVERVGTGGYQVNICREIMKQYSMYAESPNCRPNLLSKVLHLNIIKLQNYEPELSEESIQQYVSELFNTVGV